MSVSGGFGRRIFGALILAGLMSFLAPSAANAGNVINISFGNTSFVAGGGVVTVDPNLGMIADDQGRIVSATVTITNFISGEDVLAATSQHGISVSWNSGSGILTLTGNGNASQYGDVLKSVTYNNSSGTPTTTTRTISFTLTPAKLFPTTNHFYDSIAAPSLTISWTNARDAAASLLYFGLPGYLATITSASENAHLFSIITKETEWIGATDASVEGEWRWVTGPESGIQFWSGNETGSPVGGQYVNWWPGVEPNNASHFGGEEYAILYGPTAPADRRSRWTDHPENPPFATNSYLVEYGAPGADASTLAFTGIKNITFDVTAPSVVIQSAPTSVTSTAIFTVTFEFSEDVTGFALGDITVGNGAASNFVAVDGNTYTADITPSEAGDITIDVAAAAAQDGAGNDNTAAPQATVTFIGSGTITIIKKVTPAIAGNGTFTYSSDDVELNGLSLTTSGNTATSLAFSKLAGSYAVTENGLTEWRLKSINCVGDTDGGSAIDVANRRVTIDLDGGESIVCTFISVRDEDYVRTRTRRVIGNYLGRRGDQITANEPELASRLSRNGSGSGSGGPIGFTANGTLANNQLTFATSLRQILGSGEEAKAKKKWQELGQMMPLGQISLVEQSGAGEMLPGFDIWVQGTWVQAKSETRKTDLGLLYTGIEYKVSPSLLLGFMGQFDWSDEIDKSEDVAVDGTGWMIGPYIVSRLHDNLIFDGRIAWGQSDNNVDPLGLYTDSFDTTRWLARGQLTGDFNLGDWKFSPHVGVIYFEDRQKSYTDSLGIYIPGQTVALGRLTFGPQFSYSFNTGDGTRIEPHFALKGIWDFENADIVDLDTGIAASSNNTLRARIDGGVSAQLSNGWSLNGQAFYDGIGTDSLESYGGSATLSVPLN